MATSIQPSRSCLLPFYTIPIFPLFNRKTLHLLVIYNIWAIFYSERLPEAICCCLQTGSVAVVLLAMYCLRLYISFCCCLQACNVYRSVVVHMYTTFVVTCANTS